MTAQDITKILVEKWSERLAQEATGLDFNDPEDRVTFRIRVGNATEHAKVRAITEVAKALGREPTDRTRVRAVRAMADAWIARQLGTTHCKIAAS